MKLNKDFAKRLKDADFYHLIVVDDRGVGYASESSKRGVSGSGIVTLIERLGKEQQYFIEFLNEKTNNPMVS